MKVISRQCTYRKGNQWIWKGIVKWKCMKGTEKGKGMKGTVKGKSMKGSVKGKG